jgi:hypothetical protein
MTQPLPDAPGQLAARLDRDPIAVAWPAAARQQYLEWSAILLAAADLEITLGKGGLSFYLPVAGRRVFAVHFNAMPRSATPGRGFADFRRDSLQPHLDEELLLATLRSALQPGIDLRLAKVWCSLHFPWNLTSETAQAVTAAIVLPLTRVGATAA